MNKTLTLTVIMLVGLFISFLLSGLMFQYELDEIEKKFDDDVIHLTESTKASINNLVAADERLRFLFQINEAVSDDDFLVLSKTVLSQFPYVKRISYAPKIRRSHLKTEEKKLQFAGYTGFKFRSFTKELQSKSPYQDFIYPVKLIQPYTPKNSVWFGRDLLSFKSIVPVLKQISAGKLMQIVTPIDGDMMTAANKKNTDLSYFYGFSAVAFADERQNEVPFSFNGIFGVLVYELDFVKLLTDIKIKDEDENISRRILLNGMQILNQNITNDGGFFSLMHTDIIDFEGQNLSVHYRFSNPMHLVDFRTPVLTLMLGSLFTVLLFFSVKNALERQKILKDQNVMIENKVNEKTALLENQAEAITRALNHQLAVSKELESFSYSISHDLRAPLRSIGGFATVLREDYSELLDETGNDMLARVEKGASRMSLLIDDLLKLSKITRQGFSRDSFSISNLVNEQVVEFSAENTHFIIESGLMANGDRNLVKILLNNLLSNAIKYSAKVESPVVEFGAIEKEGKLVYFIKDNGAGFDMTYANKLFIAFQRLHGNSFEGTGIGLATVQRVVNRHGGAIWAESEIDKGAVFYFSLH